MVEQGFRVGFDAYVDIVRNRRPAREQEQALVDYFNGRTEDALAAVEKEHGAEWRGKLEKRLAVYSELPEGLARLKPYTGTHNAGYTECQEFYGAITLESENPLDQQVVTMLDVALRGRGGGWDDVAIPGFDFFVVEDTLGKFGERVENLTGYYNAEGGESPEPAKLPVRVQELIGTP